MKDRAEQDAKCTAAASFANALKSGPSTAIPPVPMNIDLTAMRTGSLINDGLRTNSRKCFDHRLSQLALEAFNQFEALFYGRVSSQLS